MIPTLLNLEQAATYLGRSPRWVGDAARTGTIPSRKVGRQRRFTEDDLVAYLESARAGRPTPVRRRRSA